MACYSPLFGFKTAAGGLTWSRSEAAGWIKSVPCGSCIGCRLERSRQWAVRIIHETQSHTDNSFVTLTYDDSNLPADGSLVKSHFQKFMKRLRKARENRVSFFHCGEYGDENGRPHYHAILFGVGFPDRVKWTTTPRGDKLYSSEELAKLWPLGQALIGDVTFESAAYCARYCLKKVTGDAADDAYMRVKADGEVYWIEAPYATMSLKPAIGKEWFEKYSKEVLDYDGVVVAGRLCSVPRYYDKLRDAEELRRAKVERVNRAYEHLYDQTPKRRAVRREVKEAAISLLKRSI